MVEPAGVALMVFTHVTAVPVWARRDGVKHEARAIPANAPRHADRILFEGRLIHTSTVFAEPVPDE
jgi:hypothetical protein